MKRSVRLTLAKETLAPLTTDDLHVVGGALPVTGPRCPSLDCFEVSQSYIVLTNCCGPWPTNPCAH